MKQNSGGILSWIFTGVLLVLLSATSIASVVGVAYGAGERNAEGCLIGEERYDVSTGSCVSISPPPQDLSTAETAAPGEKPIYLAQGGSVGAGEAEPFNPPTITNQGTADPQGCQPGYRFDVNASGELDCIPITTGFDPGAFNEGGTPPSPTPAGLQTCGQPGSNPATCIPPGEGGSVQNPVGSVQNPVGSVQNPGPPSGAPSSIVNPLKSTTITGFLLAIIDILLVFALPVIIFFIIYAGFLFVTARGNESQITTARTALTWSVIGGVVILGARAIIDIIQNTVKAL